MWVFTKVADAFDKQYHEENQIVYGSLKKWVGSTLYEGSPWYLNVGVYTAAGTLFAINTIPTALGAGFVDVLRIGDGVRQGGWGYAKDTLRLLFFLGPLARAARWGVSLITSVDASAGAASNCTWVAAARLLRWTGVRPFAEISDLAKAAGIGVEQTAGAWPTTLLPILRLLGATARAEPVADMSALAQLVARNSQAAIMFSVGWLRNGVWVRHTLIAVRGIVGGMKIIDRGGLVVRSLGGLEQAVKFYGPIGKAILEGEALIVENAMAVRTLAVGPQLANAVVQAAGAQVDPGPVIDSTPQHHVIVHPGVMNDGAMSARQGYTSSSSEGMHSGYSPGGLGPSHSTGSHHHHHSHGAALSPNAKKVFAVLGTGSTPVSYPHIEAKTHLHIDDVISGVQELSDKGMVKIVPLHER